VSPFVLQALGVADGGHIASLLITFFYQEMPGLMVDR
jgi:DNA gyrase/topoisomerase IV subunit B